MSTASTPRSEEGCGSETTERPSLSVQDLQDIETAAFNITITHEISFNPQFKLAPQQEQQQNELHQLISKTMERAFWDKLKEDFAQEPPRYEHALKLLVEIKEILLTLAGIRRTSWHGKIEETLDMELLQQQADTDTFDVTAVSGFIIETLATFCAPARDAEVAALREISDITELFKSIFAVGKTMSKDLANFYIQSYRPVIQQTNIQRERKNFAVLVQKLPNAMKNTKVWLRNSLLHVAGNQHGESSAARKIKPSLVFRQAYASLLEDSFQAVEENFPETLTPDQHRIFQHKQTFDRVLLVASVILSSGGLFDAGIRSDQRFWSELKTELLDIVKEERFDRGEEAIKNVLDDLLAQIFKRVHELIERSSSSSRAQQFMQSKEVFLKQADRFLPLAAHPVHKLLKARLVEYVSTVTEALRTGTSTGDDVMAAIPLPSGLETFSSELKGFARSYSKVSNINYEVYKPFHVPLLEALYKDENLSF